MQGFSGLSIKRKLTTVIMATSGVVVCLAAAGFVAYDYVSFRKNMVTELTGLTEMLEVNASTALVFHDKETAEKLLGALSARPPIVSSYILGADGDLFAQYRRAGVSEAAPPRPAE